MSEPVRWGLLSTARINLKVLAGAAGCEAVEVLAVASRSQAAAEAYAAEHAIERAYGSYEALLADRDVEAVYISLPNGLHVDWSIRALAAGKHVLCEKPLSSRASEVERAFDAADQADRLLMEAFMYRHNPQTKRLAELLHEGVVGRVRALRASFGFHLDDPSDPRLSQELEGGALLDVGCYCVNVARLLCGEPERVSGEQVLGGEGVDVIFAGVMRFPGDVLAHFDCGLLLDTTEEVVVLGEHGNLRLANPWHCHAPAIELRRDGKSEWIALDDAVDSYRLQLENLSAAIRGTAAPLLGRADALGQARAIEALYTAAKEQRAVTL
jgi:xylose dehydrogenase (NAD/NADP)